MIQGYDYVTQGLLGTLFTWFVTALGAAVVFIIPTNLTPSMEGKVLDSSLGFASGVMLAASYWSLLAPAIEMAEESNAYGDATYFPAAVGFILGAVFVWGTDYLLPHDADDAAASLATDDDCKDSGSEDEDAHAAAKSDKLRQRRKKSAHSDAQSRESAEILKKKRATNKSWRRILLLVIAVTIHNFPEGLAVGVGFGGVGIGKTTFESARMIAIGIGIQNFPEGLAVALPMRRLGYSKMKCFWYGQLSGMVEPIGGVLGAYAVLLAEPILPYALAFAAGAMVYVVVDSLVPESQVRGNSKLASWGTVVGFVVMMTLDVALG